MSKDKRRTDCGKAHFLIPEGYCLTSTWAMMMDVLLGLSLSVFLSCVFKACWNMNTVELTRTWERVKNLDVQQEEELRRELGLHKRNQ